MSRFRHLALLAVSCCAALLLTAHSARAAVPSTMSYQGVLTTNTGALVADGTYDLTFQIYDVGTDGVPLWSETQTAVPVASGGFAVTLGSVTPLGIPFDQPYWLGISVNGDAELSPRVELASSPYALGVRGPLSANLVDAQAIVDEPGIAENRLVGTHTVLGNGNGGGTSMEIELSVTITTPAAGYILVSSSGMIGITNASGEQSTKFQLAETTGNATLFFTQDAAYVYYLGFGVVPNGGYLDFPFAAQRVFYKSTPGAYTFSLGAQRVGSYTPSDYLFNPVITAVYLPSSYGAVMVAANGASPAISHADIAAGLAAPERTNSRNAGLADLRELERRDADARAQAKQAARELEQARAAAGVGTTPAPHRP